MGLRRAWYHQVATARRTNSIPFYFSPSSHAIREKPGSPRLSADIGIRGSSTGSCRLAQLAACIIVRNCFNLVLAKSRTYFLSLFVGPSRLRGECWNSRMSCCLACCRSVAAASFRWKRNERHQLLTDGPPCKAARDKTTFLMRSSQFSRHRTEAVVMGKQLHCSHRWTHCWQNCNSSRCAKPSITARRTAARSSWNVLDFSLRSTPHANAHNIQVLGQC